MNNYGNTNDLNSNLIHWNRILKREIDRLDRNEQELVDKIVKYHKESLKQKIFETRVKRFNLGELVKRCEKLLVHLELNINNETKINDSLLRKYSDLKKDLIKLKLLDITTPSSTKSFNLSYFFKFIELFSYKIIESSLREFFNFIYIQLK